jgi:hypothetical protein
MQTTRVYTDILHAYTLALNRRYSDALSALENSPECLSVPEGMDLMARTHYENGEQTKARQTWLDCIRVFPDYAPSRLALQKLRMETVRRRVVLLGIVAAIALLGGMTTLLYNAREKASSTSDGVSNEPAAFPFRKASGAEFAAAREWCIGNAGRGDMLVVACRNDSILSRRWEVFMDVAREFGITNRLLFTVLPQTNENVAAFSILKSK